MIEARAVDLNKDHMVEHHTASPKFICGSDVWDDAIVHVEPIRHTQEGGDSCFRASIDDAKADLDSMGTCVCLPAPQHTPARWSTRIEPATGGTAIEAGSPADSALGHLVGTCTSFVHLKIPYTVGTSVSDTMYTGHWDVDPDNLPAYILLYLSNGPPSCASVPDNMRLSLADPLP